MRRSLKYWLNRMLIRDIDISLQGFLYFLFCFVFVTIYLNFFLASVLKFSTRDFISLQGLVILLLTLFMLSIAGLIIDKFKDRVKLLLISSGLTIIGLVSSNFGGIFEMIGFSIMIFFTGIFLIDLNVVLTHESTILNRGRLLGFLFFLSYIISYMIVFFTEENIIVILIIECIIFYFLIIISKRYTYVETDERLKSEKSFGELITGTYSIIGYMMAFLVLGFILGNAFYFNIDVNFDLDVLVYTLLISFIVIGILLDNAGRKRSFALEILILSSLIIFSDAFGEITFFES